MGYRLYASDGHGWQPTSLPCVLLTDHSPGIHAHAPKSLLMVLSMAQSKGAAKGCCGAAVRT